MVVYFYFILVPVCNFHLVFNASIAKNLMIWYQSFIDFRQLTSSSLKLLKCTRKFCNCAVPMIKRKLVKWIKSAFNTQLCFADMQEKNRSHKNEILWLFFKEMRSRISRAAWFSFPFNCENYHLSFLFMKPFNYAHVKKTFSSRGAHLTDILLKYVNFSTPQHLFKSSFKMGCRRKCFRQPCEWIER